VEILLEGSMENAAVGGDLGKQGHRGVKFQVIRMAEDIGDRALFDVQDQLRARA